MKSVKKILIVGGAGYIGNELIQLLPKSIEVVVIDNFHIDTEYKRLTNLKLQKSRKLILIKFNVSEVSKYEKYLKDIDVVAYMASLNSYRESNTNPILYLKENNINLQVFLNALKKSSPNVKKIILTSSRGVYGEGPYKCSKCGSRFYPTLSENIKCTECLATQVSPQTIKESDLVNPTSYYGLTKKLQEDLLSMYCFKNEILLDVFRIFNVYGEDQGKYYSNIGVIPQIYEQIKNKGEMYLSGNGNLARDFVYVGDVTRVLLDSIFCKNTRNYPREIYNLGSGQSISIKDVADFFENLGYKFKRNNLKPYNDIKYSLADNSKVSKAFKIHKFTDMYDFLAKSYEKAA